MQNEDDENIAPGASDQSVHSPAASAVDVVAGPFLSSISLAHP